MDKKGFTLVELLVVIAIISIISIIAVPNVVSIMDGNKRNKFISDGISLIALAKYQIIRDSDLRNKLTNEGVNFYLKDLDKKNDLSMDPDGGIYDRNKSFVNVSKTDDNIITYCIYLKGSKRILNYNGNCVLEGIINADNAKDYVKDIEI